MVTLLAFLGVLAVLLAAAFLSTREEPLLADAPRDAADLPLPEGPLSPEDVGRLRFSLAPRGYRMAEVDLALDRLAAELADRDRRLALLEAAAAPKVVTPEPDVREATPADLPVPPPVPAPSVIPDDSVPPVVPAPLAGAPLAPPAPVTPPAEEPEPLPPAEPQHEEPHEDHQGAAAATTDVTTEQLLDALEETGPHQP